MESETSTTAKIHRPGVGYWSQIEWIQLGECGLSQLPESVAEWQHLRVLSASLNRLSALPESFGELSSLEVLNLYGNQNLTVLPESFGELSALKALNLGYTGIAHLPRSFEQLQSLEQLSFHSHEGLDLSEHNPLLALPNLRKLELAYCALVNEEAVLSDLRSALPNCEIAAPRPSDPDDSDVFSF